MIGKKILAICDSIAYFYLPNIQIVFEALKELGIKLDETHDGNNNVMSLDCENCKNCVDCKICDTCMNCKNCWYCSQLDEDEEFYNNTYDFMRNEPLTDDDKKYWMNILNI